MIAYFARHPTAANLLMLVLILMGLFSLQSLRRETFPDVTPSIVEVRIVYPGANPEEVEEAVCQRVEDAVEGIDYVKEIISDAREGFGVVTIEMEDNGNIQSFLDDIQTEVNAIDNLPKDVEKPVIRRLGRTDDVLRVLVSGPMSVQDLKAYCEDLKDRLEQLPSVSLIKLEGFSDRQFRVKLSSRALRQFNLSVSQVADIIGKQSVDLPAGGIETVEQDILVRFAEQRRTAAELEDLIIVEGISGSEVRLRQLGTVTDLFEVAEEKVLLNGRRAGILQIKKSKNQDTIRVAHAVKNYLKEERQRRPQLDIQVTNDFSVLVDDRLRMIFTNGWQGMILVFLTLWLFFNARLSFWVAMSLPVSVLGALFFLPYFNLTINMLTMVGVLLALGLLMDDGIVIAENIATHHSRGKSALRAAIDGVNEVKMGVLSSFITTALILGPLSFITGTIGKVLRVMPIVLILILAVSLIEAFCILPAHLGHSLKHAEPGKANRFRRVFDGGIDWVRENLMGRAVDVALRWRYLFIGGVLCVAMLSLSMIAGGVLKFQGFPEIDGDVIVARVLFPQGTPLKRTESVVKEITAALERVDKQFSADQPSVKKLVQNVTVRFNENTDAFEIGPHVATIYVDLLTAEERKGRLDDIMAAWRKEIGRPPEVLTLTVGEPTFGPAGRPIEIRLQGNDLDQLKKSAGELLAWFSQFEGVHNLADDQRPGKTEIRIKMREGALALGFDAGTAARQLRSAFQGVTAVEIQVGRESYEIDVQLDEADQDSLADLEYYEFTLPDGRKVPLSSVATMKVSRGLSRIARVNGRRTVTVRGDVDTRHANTAQLIAKMKSEFVPTLAEEYPDVRLSVDGESQETSITMASMLRAMTFGLVGVFVLLSIQFRSYIEPLIVMLAIPMALIGVIWGHLIMGIELSMPSMAGFISLSGVVVNDSILLVLFLKMRRAEGKDLFESAGQASRERFRAIMLTSLTTIAGLLPLLTERSTQAQTLIPLAVSITFGLMASTILVLLVIPCLYAILGDFGLTTKVETAG